MKGTTAGIDSIEDATREQLLAHIANLERESRRLVSAARLLDAEWGVEYENDSTETEYIGYDTEAEAEARAAVAKSPTDTGLRKRLVSAWIPVE